jgi:hypothetical protein
MKFWRSGVTQVEMYLQFNAPPPDHVAENSPQVVARHEMILFQVADYWFNIGSNPTFCQGLAAA